MSARYQCTRRKTGQEAPRDCHCSIHDITCLAQFLLIFLSLHLSHCYLQLLIRHILISSDHISESVRKCYFYYNNALCIHCSETYSFLFWMTNTDYHLPGGLESYCISSHIGAELTWQKKHHFNKSQRPQPRYSQHEEMPQSAFIPASSLMLKQQK